jgi:hypothetical protein
MKVKIGNVLADVWEINHEEPENDYAPWLKEACDKKLVGWLHDVSDAGRATNIPGLFLQPFLGSKAFPQPEMLSNSKSLPDLFYVAGLPAKAFSGDYLLYSAQFVNKYRIISKHKFEKDYQLVADEN